VQVRLTVDCSLLKLISLTYVITAETFTVLYADKPGVQPLNLENFFLFNEKMYNATQAYKNSRAANILFTYELARRVQDSGVKVYAICPGRSIHRQIHRHIHRIDR